MTHRFEEWTKQLVAAANRPLLTLCCEHSPVDFVKYAKHLESIWLFSKHRLHPPRHQPTNVISCFDFTVVRSEHLCIALQTSKHETQPFSFSA